MATGPVRAPVAPAVSAAGNNPAAGIGWMLVTTLLFITMDALAKDLLTRYPVNQIIWARYVFHVLALMVFLGPRVVDTMRTVRPGLQVLRSSLLFAVTALFYGALAFIPLGTISAIMHVTPLIVTLVAVPILGEAVGWRRVVSVLVGFTGALIIIRPGSADFSTVMLLPLLAAFVNAFYQVTTRVLSRHDRPLTTLAYTALVGTALSSAGLVFGWTWPDATDWAMLVAVGVIGALSHFAMIRAFTAAPAAVVSPFGYSGLVWAVLFGFVFFGEWPRWTTFAGAAIIIGSGLYILHRERVRART